MSASGIERTAYGTTQTGEAVTCFTLTGATGMQMSVLDYGGTITALTARGRAGHFADVVLGLDDLAAYEANTAFLGALIGRYANRIAGGRFSLDGHAYTLETNDPPNTLHGGARGFDKRVWEAEAREGEAGPKLILRYVSPDGEEGFPGTLQVQVTYLLREDDTLVVHYRAETDAPTPVALTQHSYFDLTGGAGDPMAQVLRLAADAFTPIDETAIPTGEVRSVDGTPFDFREPTGIADRIDAEDEQLRLAGGYDHNLVLSGSGLRLAGVLSDPASGRVLEVHTTEPGIQFYSGNHFDGTSHGKGRTLGWRTGVCLETQAFPDSPNQPGFPDTALRPGELYESTTEFRFRVAE
ncbi:aldose epimerase family protein [Parvularcula dongshanensis]|uniref:Aldose 1-epimerase n=1 Tax=Parvularcula dongshanensis TaxID=1173995 RepID=A0A840I767_9PROT|nr:aldose epimerase family protein [Parvularcula dongshanensis]MBB4659948.1 aldose 1-epimerase [Parvularcula dongshanensis]